MAAAAEAEDEKGGRHYIHWSRLLKRVFGIDSSKLPELRRPADDGRDAGGRAQQEQLPEIIAAIEQPNAIHKILTHLGLQAHPPPRAPVRYDPEREADLFPWPAVLHSSVH